MRIRPDIAPISALAALLITSIAASASHARVDARLDRSHVTAGEALTLTVRARDGSLGEEPDLAPLERNFHVLGVSRSHRTTVVNGRRDEAAEWHVTLVPRGNDDTEVPAIQFGQGAGSRATDPIPVSVSTAPTPAGSAPGATPPNPRTDEQPRARSGPPVTLSARIDETSPYVQQQVVLTLRLEAAVPIVEGQITEPAVPGAIVERLGEDVHGSSDIDGREVSWIERRFAIFPQQSGPLAIDPVAFEGVTPVRTRAPARTRRGFGGGLHERLDALMGASIFDDPFFDDAFLDDFFAGGLAGGFGGALGSRGESVHAVSSPITLDVRPRSAEATGPRWLPARNLALVEMWADGRSEPPSLRVGEPIDRVVAVRALGVTATQLPAPALPDADGFKQYASPAQTDTEGRGDDMVAIRAVPTTLIPTRAGDLTLPAIEIAWWDTEADAPRTTVLPARTVNVLPTDDTDPAIAAAPPTDPSSGMDTERVLSPEPAPSAIASQRGLYVGAAIAVLIGTGFAAAWARRQRGKRVGDRPVRPAGAWARRRARMRAERALRRACRRGDADAAESALIEVGRALWPERDLTSAAAVARAMNDAEIEREVVLLLSSRYAAGESKWNGDSLWTAWRGRRLRARSHGSTRRQSALPDLYPKPSA